MTLTYTTVQQLVDHSPEPDLYEGVPEKRINALIEHASRLMRRHTRAALYAVTEDGTPEDDDLAHAFTEAAEAQVEAWIVGGVAGEILTGGATAEATVSSSTNNGSSVTLDDSTGASARQRLLTGGLCPLAELILHDAGLLSGKPWIRW